ncbi:hypothetical protein C2S51_017483 [Perilla frutescens var. frutescens]|nr:hypothetical protein C2S51_017483 [Perilla frutescens var. frutescens]
MTHKIHLALSLPLPHSQWSKVEMKDATIRPPRRRTPERIIGGTPDKIIEGSQIWVEDPEVVWIDGRAVKMDGDEVEVETSDGRMTYSGGILIAINPFQRLPDLYDPKMMERYNRAPFGELSPHVFAIGEAAFREMMNDGQSNSILVSGESGDGKTETTKMLMQYLTYLGGHKGCDQKRTVEQQVLEFLKHLEKPRLSEITIPDFCMIKLCWRSLENSTDVHTRTSRS